MPLSFQEDIKFRNVSEVRVAVGDSPDGINFTGGFVTDKHETKLNPSQSPDLANVVFNDTGSIKTRNGYLRYNPTPVGVSADQSNTGASSGSLTIDDAGEFVAQTFQASGAINSVFADVYLAMATSGQEQYVRLEVWSTSGGEPDEMISHGQSQIKLVSGTSETLYSFGFREPMVLSAATTYALVVKPFIKGTQRAFKVYHRGTTYADGQVYTTTDSGGSWTGDSAKDLRFVVYSGGNTGCTGLIRYYGDGGIQQLIAKFGTSLYRGNDGTGAMTAITLGSGVSLSAADYVDYTISNGTLLVVDGSNKIQKYRGSTNANYSTGTITVTNNSASITGSSTVWNTSTNAQTGEYIKLPDGKWYRITAIASDTGLTIETAYKGSTLAGQTYVISPWGEVQGDLNRATLPASLVRPTGKAIENHANRIWNLDGNTLRFSALDTSIIGAHFNDWDTSSNAGAIIIPSGKGDKGTALYSFNGVLYVFQRRSIWGLYGTSPATFQLRNISNEIGLIDRKTLVEWNDVLLFLTYQGVYMFDGSNLRNLTDNVINNHLETWADKTSPAATLWGNRYILSYKPSGGTYNSEAIYYDLTRQVWGKMEGLYAGVWSNWTGGTDTGQIYFGSSSRGAILRWDIGGNDDGYEITTRYSTPSMGLEAALNDKSIKRFYLQYLALGDWTMDVVQRSDITAEDITTAISMSGGESVLWDVAEWDVDMWPSEGMLLTERIAEFQGLAKFFKFVFEQTGYDEGFEILAMLLTARQRRLI